MHAGMALQLTISTAGSSAIPRRTTSRSAVRATPAGHRSGALISLTALRGGSNFARKHLPPVAAMKTEDGDPNSDHEEVLDISDASEPSVFAEPFLRSFILGLSAAALIEIVHTLSEYVEGLDAGTIHNLFQLSAAGFRPAMYLDHQVALVCWFILYIMEVVAVASVLKQSHDKAAAKEAISQLTTISRRLMPLRLTNLVKWVFAMTAPASVTAAPSLSAAAAQAEINEAAGGPRPTPLSVVSHWSSPTSIAEEASAPTGGNKTAGTVAGGAREKLEDIFRRNPGGGTVFAPTGPETLTPRRQKELIDRKAYLKNFWYAAALASDVKKGKPKGITILGMKLVLFRDESDGGKIKCINDICPHRAAPLSEGWVEEVEGHTCVVCPYHGWAFDGDGRLQDVPAADKGETWPRRPLVSNYDVVERGGFIWLFNGSRSLPMDERPPIPTMPELEDPDWHPIFGEFHFDAPHWGVFQNAIDMAHIHYLHDDSFGNQEKPDIRAMKEIETDAWGVVSQFKLTNKPVNALWEFTSVPEVEVTAKAMLPSTSVISFTLGAGVSFITFVNTVPIDEHRSVNRYALIRNRFNAQLFDPIAKDAMKKILGEDKVMVEKLRPELLEQEISVRADTIQTLFGKLRQEYIDLGYGVPANGTACSTPLDKQQP